MDKVIIKKEIEAYQWESVDKPLPEGCVLCQPEVHWSANRKLVYFTYGDLLSRHWMGVEKLKEKPDTNRGLSGWIGYTPKDGSPEYYREWLPFAFWSVKSESSMTGDHRAVFLNTDDPEMVTLWHNYCSGEQWENPIRMCAEHRIPGGQYGRGYKPVYFYPGDWMIREKGQEVRFVSDKEFQRMREIPSKE